MPRPLASKARKAWVMPAVQRIGLNTADLSIVSISADNATGRSS